MCEEINDMEDSFLNNNDRNNMIKIDYRNAKQFHLCGKQYIGVTYDQLSRKMIIYCIF